jgi:hypothetical protein
MDISKYNSIFAKVSDLRICALSTVPFSYWFIDDRFFKSKYYFYTFLRKNKTGDKIKVPGFE